MTTISSVYNPFGDLVKVYLPGQQLYTVTVPWAEWLPLWTALRDGDIIPCAVMPCGCCLAFPLPASVCWQVKIEHSNKFCQALLATLEGALWWREHGGGIRGYLQRWANQGDYRAGVNPWSGPIYWTG